MAYVPVPKDLTKVKTKVMFNLTKRQLICFGLGIVILSYKECTWYKCFGNAYDYCDASLFYACTI